MPQITQTKRGRAGTWRTGKKPQKTTVNINSHIIKQNIKKSKFERKPVIAVKGKKKIYVHQLEIPAPCRIIYDPDKPLDCLGARTCGTARSADRLRLGRECVRAFVLRLTSNGTIRASVPKGLCLLCKLWVAPLWRKSLD